MKWAAALVAALAAVLAGAPAASQPLQNGYRLVPGQSCDGYPRLQVGMADGMCMGLVYARPQGGSNAAGPAFPRTVLELPSGAMLIVAMGSWTPGQGSVWLMTHRPGRTPGLRRVLRNLNLPHIAAIGPDGRVYLGEMNRIFRFDPEADDPQATIETVVRDLPSNRLHDNRHPLSMFLFDAGGDLILNVGAPTDQCASPTPRRGLRCTVAEGPQAAAAIWRYAYRGNGRWSDEPTVIARGLRNSMALARHASGTLLQAENSIDLAPVSSPFEELNVIREGRHYGWPYCMDIATPAPAWRAAGAMDCTGPQHTPPSILLAPHGAPLGMLFYDGPMFPQLRGRLLVGLHGYRPTGGRIMAYQVDGRGIPVIERGATYPVYRAGAGPARRTYLGPGQTGLNLTPNWDAVRGIRPLGRPVGLTVARDGSIWIAEDHNNTIVRIAVDRP